MRKVIVAMQVTLDGFVEGPNGEMDWLVYNDQEAWDDLFDQIKSADTFLLGRGMYPAYANYWRAALANPSSTKNEIEYARIADKTQHIVFSRTMKETDWKNTRIVGDNIAEEISKMKRQPGKDMIMLGGPSIVTTFMNLGLIDEFRLLVNPIVLSGGNPLFKNVNSRYELKLSEAKAFNSGVVLLRYQTESKGK